MKPDVAAATIKREAQAATAEPTNCISSILTHISTGRRRYPATFEAVVKNGLQDVRQRWARVGHLAKCLFAVHDNETTQRAPSAYAARLPNEQGNGPP